MATSGRHMARFSARDCAIGPVRTVPIHPSSQISALRRAARSGHPWSGSSFQSWPTFTWLGSRPGSSSSAARAFYEEHGQGEPLVLVHGYGQDHTAWLDPLDDYARYFRTIIIDARGGGQSGVPEPGYKILDMVHDVTALMDHLKLDKTHFSGFSMGGAIGQEMAIHYPEKLLTLSLNSTWEGGPCPHMDRWVNIRSILIAQNDPVVNVGTRIVSFFSPEWCNKNEDRVAQFIERADSNAYPMGERAI